MFQHPILMDARFMGKGVCAHNGLIGLHHKSGDAGHQAGRPHNMRGINVGAIGQQIRTGFDGHDNFFHGGIARPLAQTVDGAFHLPRPILNTGQTVGHRQSQIVVTMGGDYRQIDVGHRVFDGGDEIPIFQRHGIPHSIRDVDGAGAGLDGGFHGAKQKITLAAHGIFGGPFHILHQGSRQRHTFRDGG